MDLEENIRISAEMQAKADISDNFQGADHKYKMGYYQGVISGFKDGAKSQAVKDYWYNEFKREELSKLDNIPFKPEPMIFGTGDGLTDEENELLQKQVIEPGYEEQHQYQQYLKDNPDRPISFNNWKYMVEHYQAKVNNLTDVELEEAFTWIDKDGFDVLTGKKEPSKRIGIIGHVNHGSSCLGLRTVREKIESEMNGLSHNTPMVIVLGEPWDASRQALDIAVKSRSIGITEIPIVDGIIEQVKELEKRKPIQVKTYDITSIPEAWDIRKQKKVNHKRNNKRK